MICTARTRENPAQAQQRLAEGGAEPTRDRQDHQVHRDDHEYHESQRHNRRQRVPPQERSFLLALIDDVQRLDQRLHAGIGAPHRDGKADDEGAEILARPRDELADEILDEQHDVLRHDMRHRRDESPDVRGIAEEAVKRDQRRKPREYCEHHKKSGGCRNAGDVVLEDDALDKGWRTVRGSATARCAIACAKISGFA